MRVLCLGTSESLHFHILLSFKPSAYFEVPFVENARTLDRTLRDLKTKLHMLVRKADKDDALIKALQGEVTRLKV